MKEFIETIVKQLVDKPDEVVINAVETEQRIIYELSVGEGDFGKVIGKHGRNISAIRTLVFAINAKEGGKRARLDIIDD
ncbi:MAG: KH domain-containing protein [Candidatus Neomarinimicrobiota bacterium]